MESASAPGISIRVLDAGGAELASAAPAELTGLNPATTSLTQGPTGEGILLAAESGDSSATVVARVNSDLSVAWTIRLEAAAARVRSTPSGGVIIVGTAEVGVSIDAQSWPVDRGPRSFATWLSSDGTVEAVRVLGSTTPADFVVTADDNVILATESCPLCSARRGTDFARYTVDRYSPAGELVGRGEIPGLAMLAADGTGVIAAGHREIVVGDPMGDGYIGTEAFATRFDP